jgi:hypothetical protein
MASGEGICGGLRKFDGSGRGVGKLAAPPGGFLKRARRGLRRRAAVALMKKLFEEGANGN